jgi:hypothetical protein
MRDLSRRSLPQSFTTSPQQAAPLSWFTGPQFARVLGIALLVQSVPAIVALWDAWTQPALQLLALPFLLAATFITSRSTRANGGDFTLARGALILAVAAVGVLLSALGAVGGTVQVEHWWAATAMGVVYGGLAPISSAARLLILGLPVAAGVGGMAAMGFLPSDRWVPVALVVIGCSPILLAIIACVAFVIGYVRLTRDALAALEAAPPQGDVAEPPCASQELALAHDRMVAAAADGSAFLARVADTGVVTEADRVEAETIAVQLRSTLVAAATRSWLDVVAEESGLTVVDPDGLADWMDPSQRAALRGLLTAVVDNPVVDESSLGIELRAQEDGSIAVAVRLNVDLPEGRRVMMLAPYYLTLKMAVGDLSWADGREMLFRFQIKKPPRGET